MNHRLTPEAAVRNRCDLPGRLALKSSFGCPAYSRSTFLKLSVNERYFWPEVVDLNFNCVLLLPIAVEACM